MSFSQLDRAYIRRFLGYGAIFLQAFPLVENAATAVQSLADGGTQPDSTSENMIKAWIYGSAAVTGTAGVTPGGASTTGTTFSQPAIRGLLQIEQAIAFQDALIGAVEAEGDAKMDSYREIARLRSEGQRICNQIAFTLGMKCVLQQVFFTSSAPFDGSMRELFPFSQYW